MNQEKLEDLAIMCIESDLLRDIDFSDVVSDFARRKSRKKNF